MIFSFLVTHSSSVRASKQHQWISTDLCVVLIKMVLSKNLIDCQLVNECTTKRERDELIATNVGKLFHHLLLTAVWLENERVFACLARPTLVVSIYLIEWRTRRRNLEQIQGDAQEIRSSSSGDIYSRKKRICEQRIEKWNTGRTADWQRCTKDRLASSLPVSCRTARWMASVFDEAGSSGRVAWG